MIEVTVVFRRNGSASETQEETHKVSNLECLAALIRNSAVRMARYGFRFSHIRAEDA